MDTILNQILSFSQGLAGKLSNVAIAMAAVGVLSMALIQTAKDVLPLRRYYHQWKVRKWLANETDDFFVEAKTYGLESNPVRKAEKDLVTLATAGDSEAFYSLPIEQLCGQINAAAQAVIDNPHRYKELLGCLSTRANVGDVTNLWGSPQGDKPSQEITEARSRVAHQIQRSIDALQIAAASQWQRFLHVFSFVVSFIICFLGITTVNGANNLAVALVFGLAGAFLAPVARDLVASLQQLRK